jgi:hypothetical protein
MKKTKCQIYYSYSEEVDLIEIRAFWGAKRKVVQSSEARLVMAMPRPEVVRLFPLAAP